MVYTCAYGTAFNLCSFIVPKGKSCTVYSCTYDVIYMHICYLLVVMLLTCT